MKKLTIAIPTYNREEFIRCKIEEISSHIIENDLTNFIDLMVVDNCSNTYDVEKLRFDYSNIDFLKIYTNSSNIGAGANFLRCIELANSEYVWLLGDDENLELNDINSSSLLEELLECLNDCDCYLLPHNDDYAEKATYFGKFFSVDDLLENFFHFSSFVVLSIYILKKNAAIKYLRTGYETVLYQHPYSAIALQMLKSGSTIELVNIPILKVQPQNSTRFDIVNAQVDVLYTYKLILNQKEFLRYLKHDFFLREKSIFSLNIGILNQVSLMDLAFNYKRLMIVVPFFSKAFFKGMLWLGLVNLRRFNRCISFLLFLFSRISKNSFSMISYSEICLLLSQNISCSSNLRH